MSPETLTHTVGIIGARGYVGRELIGLLDHHPALTLSLAASSSQAGASVRDALGAGPADLAFTTSDHTLIARDCPDILILALPNGEAHAFVEALDRAGTTPRLILDLSADMRFSPDWTYSIPEIHAAQVTGASRISNPGCYATAMQLALAPLSDLITSTPHCFGISGYSGAGATPSERNNESRLTGGVLPYSITGHLHEREVTAHLNRPTRFTPSVAPFFRGIVLTALFDIGEGVTAADLIATIERHYADSPIVSCIGTEVPRVQDVINTPGAIIGGVSVDVRTPNQAGIVCVIDNLLKGAASQALQNINLALKLPPLMGISI